MNREEKRTSTRAAAYGAARREAGAAEPTSLKEGNVPCTNTASDPVQCILHRLNLHLKEGMAWLRRGEAKKAPLHCVLGYY